jgi:hypothetical protein
MATKDAGKRQKKLNVINIRVDDAMLAELRELAEIEGRPLANYVVQALRLHLAERRKNAAG